MQIVGRLRELVGDDRRHRVLRRVQRQRHLRRVADHHRDRHRLTEGAPEAEHDRTDDAGAGVEEGHPDRFPARGAQRVRAFPLCLGHRSEHLARDRRAEGHDHDREQDGRRQHPKPQRGTTEERQRAHPLRCAGFQPPDKRDQDEDAPEAVDNGRNGGEELGQEHQRLAEPGGRQLRNVDRDAECDGPRDDQREHGGVQRAPDERPRAELAGNRIPDLGLPELPAELPDRRRRVGIQDKRDPRDQRDQDHAEQTRPDAKAEVVETGRFHHALRDLNGWATGP